MNALRLGLFAAVFALPSGVSAQQWGTIKGQFVIQGGKVPPAKAFNVAAVPACLAFAPINSEEYIVDPKTLGVRNVVVWIAPEKNGIADHATNPAIHQDLVKIKEKQVVVDQPCCKFEPHIQVLRIGQDFVGKNSAGIAHNMNIMSLAEGGVKQNLALAPNAQLTVPAAKWKPYYYPSEISCGIHPWMKSRLFVLDHPYFAISDKEGKFEIKNVPAGKLRILIWHEGPGWVHEKVKGKPGFSGQGITVEGGKTLDLGKVSVKYPPD